MTVPDRTIITEPSTKSVDEFATRISRRVRASGPDFAEVATAVRGLQKTLGHLRSEAEDSDSLLNQAGSAGRNAVYSRQLTSLVEDSDFVLKQVQAVLERYGGAEGSDGAVTGRNAHLRSDDDMQERRGKLDLLQKEVTSQRIKIDMFLDTVQLHNPARNQQVLENTDGHELDAIKDKVDAVAARLFRNRTSPVEGPDDIWQDFKVELEKEGFKSEVLRKNKVRSRHRCRTSHVFRERRLPVARRSCVPTFASWSPTSAPTGDLHHLSAVCSLTAQRPMRWRPTQCQTTKLGVIDTNRCRL